MNKIKSIEYKNFRVYTKETFDISPDKNIVLIHGNNGLGKTSFFDGIEWGLTGKIQRYDKAAKEKYEYIILKNTLINNDTDSYVKINFSDNNYLKRLVNLKENKDYNIGKVVSNFKLSELISNEYTGKMKFEDSFAFSQFLSQELIDSFIREMKDTDRYTSIKNLLGLYRYEKYETFIENVSSETSVKLDELINEIRIENKCLESLIENKTNVTLEDDLIKYRCIKYIGDKFDINDINNNISVISNILAENIKTYDKLINENKKICQSNIEVDGINNDNEYNNYLINKIELNNLETTVNDDLVIINNIKKYNELKYLFDNYKKFKSINENKNNINLLNEKYDQDKSLLIKINKCNNNIEKIITYCRERNLLNEISKAYETIDTDLKSINKLINIKNKELENMMNLKQTFINTTLNYLNSNNNINKCPVCKQSFNLSNTILELNKELDNNLEIGLESLLEELKENKEISNYLTIKKNNLEEQILDEFKLIKNNIEVEVNKVKSKIDLIMIYDDFLKDYYMRISKLGIKVNELNQEYIKSDKVIKSLEEKSIEYYLGLIENSKEREKKLKEKISKTEFILNKYNINSLRDIKYVSTRIKHDLVKCDEEIKINEIIISELKELLNHFNNNIHMQKINISKTKLKELKSKEKKLNNIHQSFQSLKKNNRDILLNEIERILKSDNMPIKILYNYLNPNNNFQKLNFRVDNTNPKNNRLMVEAISESGAVINPAYSFSSAQNNVLAVSIFLSFALTQKWSNLDCIFMDDPIQNMDDINVNNFVDIVRNIVRTTNKQFFISTHDKRIFDFMKNKFGDDVQTFKFIDYGCIKKGD